MANSADPDQLASSEANWSGSTLFAKAGYIRVQQDKGLEFKTEKKNLIAWEKGLSIYHMYLKFSDRQAWANSLDHICHISHCEIKSHRIWPIWKAIPIKNSNLTEFSDHFTTDFMKKLT